MENKDRLQKLLKELFQFDNADLDFGIYRIMNKKREEIENFINHDLINYIEDELSTIESKEKEGLEKELERVKEEANNLGIDYTQVPKYQEIKEEMAQYNIEENLESNIYNDIYTFFKRYYENGDFLSKRRYSSQDKYAIPYNGEEVYLHWANNDQYYIKTSEEFNNYSFSQNNTKVYFQIKNAKVEKNNNKSDEDRYFVLKKDNFFNYNSESNVLKIYFEYRNLSDEEKSKYKTRNTQSDIREHIQKDIQEKIKNDADLFQELNWLINDSNKVKSLLAKHLYKYTVKNKSDYFIHKDLKGFLERELDFFIKNEIVDVDTIGTASEKNISAYMTRIKVIKKVCQKIIDFLAQIENFQKKLFEKKKFVLQDEYCLTLDKIPSEIRDNIFNQVLKNDDQLKEWEDLYGVNIKELKDLYHDDANLFNTESLKKIVIDTRYFNEDFKEHILTSFNNLEEEIEGLMINSENYQALNLMLEKYKNGVKCIYIDPPYNTGGDEFVYKDNYQHSSWLTMMENRLKLANKLLKDNGAVFIQIDYHELSRLKLLCDSIFGEDNFVQLISIKTASAAGFKTVNPGPIDVTEYLLFYTKDKSSFDFRKGYSATDYDTNYNRVIKNYDEKPENWELISIIDEIYSQNEINDNSEAKDIWGEHWKLIRDTLISEYALENAEKVVSIRDPHKPTDKLKKLLKKSKKDDKVIVMERENYDDLYVYNGGVLAFYSNKVKIINGEKTPTKLLTDFWSDISWAGIAGEGNVSLKNGKKPESLIKRVIELTTNEGDLVLDFFLGSGTTTAVAQKLTRKYIGIEMGSYFNSKCLPRMKYVLNNDNTGISKDVFWEGGGFFKYQSLEQYEDSLDNIRFAREKELNLFNKYDDYLINYMLDYETRDSLLDLDMFSNPFNYYLEITEGKEKVKKKVDLVETFNYLIGLKVKQRKIYTYQERKFIVIFGEKDNNEIAVIWRNTEDLNFEQERKFIEDEIISDKKIDKLYLNGDNYLENSFLIEDQFNKLMF